MGVSDFRSGASGAFLKKGVVKLVADFFYQPVPLLGRLKILWCHPSGCPALHQSPNGHQYFSRAVAFALRHPNGFPPPLMKFLRTLLSCLGFVANLSSPYACGELLVHEGFDYPVGVLQDRAGGRGWAGPYEDFGGRPSGEVIASKGEAGFGAGHFARFARDSYHFRQIDTLGIARAHINERGSLGVPGTSLWLSLFIRAQEPILPPFFGISLFEDGDERLFLGKGRMEKAGWKIQTQKVVEGERGNAFSGNYLEPHWIVLKIDFRNDGSPAAEHDRVYMFLNPDPKGPAPASSGAAGEVNGILDPMTFNRIRIVGNGHGFLMNDLRIGTSFASVSPAAEAGTVLTTR